MKNITPLELDKINSILTWCKRHDWCQSASFDGKAYQVNGKAFASFKSIRIWAGY